MEHPVVDRNTKLNIYIANRLKKHRQRKIIVCFTFYTQQNLNFFTYNIDFDTKSLRVSPVEFFK